MILRHGSPSFQSHTTAAVTPWKVERIGFEQAGRVVQVIEPNEMVKANSDRQPGTPLARLAEEKLLIAVEAAKADMAVAERQLDTSRVAIEQSFPAGIKTAESEYALAQKELARARRLGNAISRSESDTIRTRASTAKLRIDSAKADLAQAEARQQSLAAQRQQAQQRLAEAKRNLKNTILFSSFPGQVVAVHAVPGSYVKEGDPVATIQMVDPMVIEFEVTAEDSRRYRRGDSLMVAATDGSGNEQQLNGMVYTVDGVADESTRTFTVTLHVRNQPDSPMTKIDSAALGPKSANTQFIFPLNLGPIVTGDQRLLVEQSAIHRIDGKDYVWKITNRSWDKVSNANDRVLKVIRVPVRIKSETLPFLGAWNFVAIEFEDPTTIDLNRDLITGSLSFNSSTPASESELSSWQGDEVTLEQTRWMLRPGDVVRVMKIAKTSVDGFYVPMKAVRQENDRTFVHVVEENDGQATSRRIFVSVAVDDSIKQDSVLLRIEPADDKEDSLLREGCQLVIGGTHYLDDMDRVRVVPSVGDAR